MDVKQLKDLIQRVLADINMYSDDAVDQVLGTIAQESKMGFYIRQLGNGPARGIGQIEPATERDNWDNFIIYKPKLAERIKTITGRSGPGPWLEWDLAYNIIMIRIKYYRVPSSIPEDLAGKAAFWKKYYNSPLGAGTEQEYIANYKKYVMAAR